MKAQNARTSRRTAAMKKTGIAFVVLAIILVSCDVAHAQKVTPKSAPVTIAPDLTKLNIEKMLQQVQTTRVQPSAQDTSPLQVVAEFLQLRPGQVSEVEQLLQARQTTLVPLFQTAQAQIHALQEQMAQAQQAFLTQFVAILDTDQLQKLQAVQIAAQLQPILPAFQPIFLF
jgi:hypothetical protein